MLVRCLVISKKCRYCLSLDLHNFECQNDFKIRNNLLGTKSKCKPYQNHILFNNGVYPENDIDVY